MFIFRYSKTIQVYYQNFLEENKHCKFFISFRLTIHGILSNTNKKHFRVRACVRARARAHARITKKELESIATKDIKKFT